MEFDRVLPEQKTAHFIGEKGRPIIITAQRLKSLFDQVMGGKNERGEYNKDLRSVGAEIYHGDHDPVFSDPTEKEIVYSYTFKLLDFLRVKWFNHAGSVITFEDYQRMYDLYLAGEKPTEEDTEQVRTWFEICSLRTLLDEYIPPEENITTTT